MNMTATHYAITTSCAPTAKCPCQPTLYRDFDMTHAPHRTRLYYLHWGVPKSLESVEGAQVSRLLPAVK